MTAEKTDALKPYLQLLLSVMNEMFAGLRFANKKTQQIALSRLQKRMEAVSAKLSNDNDNGQEAAPDEQTTAVKRRQLTDAEILENKSFMPEKPEDLAYVPGLIGGNSKKLTCYIVNFHLQDIEPMVWNDKACEHLVYDPQQKDLVLSFVESHGRASTLQRYVMTLEGMESCIKVTNPQAGKSQGSKDDNGGLYG
ncbi:hypothetical protein MBR_09310, partial [Metarhizium brunneum ARSEF 3297]